MGLMQPQRLALVEVLVESQIVADEINNIQSESIVGDGKRVGFVPHIGPKPLPRVSDLDRRCR